MHGTPSRYPFSGWSGDQGEFLRKRWFNPVGVDACGHEDLADEPVKEEQLVGKDSFVLKSARLLEASGSDIHLRDAQRHTPSTSTGCLLHG